MERQTADHAVRASFAVRGEPYVAGDLEIDGLPITRGGQQADKVRVRLDTFAKPGGAIAAQAVCHVVLGECVRAPLTVSFEQVAPA